MLNFQDIEEHTVRDNLRDEMRRHMRQCEFRVVSCYHWDCQLKKRQFSLALIEEHFKSVHKKYFFENLCLNDPDQMEIGLSNLYSYQSGSHEKIISGAALNIILNNGVF